MTCAKLRPRTLLAKVMQGASNADIFVVEPNVTEHNVFKLTNYNQAYDKADIVVSDCAYSLQIASLSQR